MKYLAQWGLLLSSVVQASEYQRFEDLMDYLGYSWEAIKVHTDDKYILTTFHVTGRVGEDPFIPTMPPVLLNHGDCADGTSWLDNNSTYGLPMHL